MKNIRIKYEIGLQNGDKYHVKYSVLCNERNQNVELLKAWILYFYKIIFNYGESFDQNVISLFNFLSSLKNMNKNNINVDSIEKKYSCSSLMNMSDCTTNIAGETFDIVNSGIGINVSFPKSINSRQL